MQFANESACTIIAEGVETAAELKALRAIGVSRAQGYFLGRPLPLANAAALCRRASDDDSDDLLGSSAAR
jgi:EAL domain-containing protein (putative c-di-GMP-specific phosphodiesterase class I)